MIISVLSDLHCEFYKDDGKRFIDSIDLDGVDVLVLAGDINHSGNVRNTIDYFSQKISRERIVYVAGNHEYYAKSVERKVHIKRLYKTECWLENQIRRIDGRRFIGCTLWYGETISPERQQVLANIGSNRVWVDPRRVWSDFEYIPDLYDWVEAANKEAISFLEKNIQKGDIVVTHFLPSPKSIAPQWQGDKFNCFFLTDMTDVILDKEPLLWIHGHTHSSMDYQLGSTRVVCNPKGYDNYLGVGRHENENFNRNFTVQI